MKTKPVNPYSALLEEAQTFVRQATRPNKRVMFLYPKDKVVGRSTYRLDDLAERVAAADQLGYDVHLVNKEDGLNVIYVKRLPPAP